MGSMVSGSMRKTHDALPQERLAGDASEALEVLYGGGVAILPLDVAYAIVGHTDGAIRRIFTAKRRSYEKPSGLLATATISEAVHILPDRKREMIRAIIEEEKLPFSVVAPFHTDHPFLRSVDAFTLANSTKAGTIDMLLNAGFFHDEIARQSWAAGKPVFGSSANTSLRGSKYRLGDIEAEVRGAADIAFDYGESKYANAAGHSSTIIDFRNFTVIRVGVCFERLAQAFRSRFDVELRRPT